MTIGADLGFPEEKFRFEADSRWVLPNCRVGVEIEVEKFVKPVSQNEPWFAFWEAKRDGSLHDAGMEFVFRQPLFGIDAYKAIVGFCEHAERARYVSSIRTGIHVHLDARDLEIAQLQRLCVLYALYEKAIYNYVGNNREENVFCLPWYMSTGATKAVKAVIGARGAAIKAAARQIADEKYAGLNLDPLARFGSIEFRHLLTTFNVNRIIEWVNIVMRLKEAACRLKPSGEQLIQIAQETGAVALGEEAFRDQYQHLHYEQIQGHMIDTGVPTAIDVIVNRKLEWPYPGQSSVKKSTKFSAAIAKFREAKVAKPPPKTKKKTDVNLNSFSLPPSEAQLQRIRTTLADMHRRSLPTGTDPTSAPRIANAVFDERIWSTAPNPPDGEA